MVSLSESFRRLLVALPMTLELAIVTAAPAHVDRTAVAVGIRREVVLPTAEHEAEGIRDNVAKVFEIEHGGHVCLLLVKALKPWPGRAAAPGVGALRLARD